MNQVTDLSSSFINQNSKDKKGSKKLLRKYEKALKFKFDYERNNFINSNKNSKQFDSNINSFKFYNNDNNYFPDSLAPKFHMCKYSDEKVCSKIFNSIRSCVSGSRIRFIDRYYNLDLVFITNRVLAMGYPSDSFLESCYRNPVTSIRNFFRERFNNKVKIYNLCLEPNKIYNKCYFEGCNVALYPISDHCCCPIQMMLEFSADICSYILNNSDSYIAVHCKAGKGRTGSMICAYLIFSGISKSANEAMDVYALRRSKELKGVTVPSQRRYLHHFETFLNLTFEKPFFKQVPKIFRMYSSDSLKKNLLHNIFINEANEFFKYGNIFYIKRIKIGPFNNKFDINLKIFNFRKTNLFDSANKKNCNKSEINTQKRDILEMDEINQSFIKDIYYINNNKSKNNSLNNFDNVDIDQDIEYKITTIEEDNNSSTNIINKKNYYFIYEFLSSNSLKIDSDTEIQVKSSNIDFFFWINLYYITLEKFVDFIAKVLVLDKINKTNNKNYGNDILNKEQFTNSINYKDSKIKNNIFEFSNNITNNLVKDFKINENVLSKSNSKIFENNNNLNNIDILDNNNNNNNNIKTEKKLYNHNLTNSNKSLNINNIKTNKLTSKSTYISLKIKNKQLKDNQHELNSIAIENINTKNSIKKNDDLFNIKEKLINKKILHTKKNPSYSNLQNMLTNQIAKEQLKLVFSQKTKQNENVNITINNSTIINNYNLLNSNNSNKDNIKNSEIFKHTINNSALKNNLSLNNKQRSISNKNFSSYNSNSLMFNNNSLTSFMNNLEFMKVHKNELNNKMDLYFKIKLYLKKYTKYLDNDLIQLSDLNLIYNMLYSKYSNEINKEKVFRFVLNNNNLDKYLGPKNRNLSIEIIYTLN